MKHFTVRDMIRQLQMEDPDAVLEFQFIGYHFEEESGMKRFMPTIYKTIGFETMVISQENFRNFTGSNDPPYQCTLRILSPAEPVYTDRIARAESGQFIQWHPCETVNDAYIRNHGVLHHGREKLLITYKSPNGRKYVTVTNVDNGRIQKTIHGEVLAWAYLPEPYDEETQK